MEAIRSYSQKFVVVGAREISTPETARPHESGSTGGYHATHVTSFWMILRALEAGGRSEATPCHLSLAVSLGD